MQLANAKLRAICGTVFEPIWIPTMICRSAQIIDKMNAMFATLSPRPVFGSPIMSG